MPLWKGTAFYNLRNAGWSETYPISNTTLTPAAALNVVNTMNTARLALSPNEVMCEGIRVSDELVKGDGYTQTPTTTQGTYVTVDTWMPVTDTFRVRSGDIAGLKRSIRHIHAVPFDQFNATLEKWVFTAPYIVLINAYLADLLGFVSIETKHLGGVPPPTFTAVTSAAYEDIVRERKVGRPFGLAVGRRAIA